MQFVPVFGGGRKSEKYQKKALHTSRAYRAFRELFNCAA